MDTSKLIPVFKALSDDIRLSIVDMLKEKELCASEILAGFSITQPTLSYHMKLLTGSGLVTFHKEGAKTVYTLVPECMQILADYAAGYASPAKATAQRPAPQQEEQPPRRRPAQRRQMDSYLL